MKKQQTKNVSSKEVRKLVIARLKALSSDRTILIGADGKYSKEELIKRVEKNDKVGKKVVDIQLHYLQSLKKGLFLNE